VRRALQEPHAASVPHVSACSSATHIPRWVQNAPTGVTLTPVGRVIQIRDVPDDVHEALRAAAKARGQSLTKFALAELEQAARRSQSAQRNAEVIRRAKTEIGADVPREAILAAIRESRGE
jgi:hypothetical protein